MGQAFPLYDPKTTMKKYLSTIVFGCLGLCAGFTLCYVYIAIPLQEGNLTQSVVPQATEHSRDTIRIARDGGMYLGNERVGSTRLRSFLIEQAAKGSPVIIRADKNADVTTVSSILDGCRTAGVWNVAFARTTTE